jgi:hypothetical protein
MTAGATWYVDVVTLDQGTIAGRGPTDGFRGVQQGRGRGALASASIMTVPDTRELTEAERASVARVLRRLREHFREWKPPPGCEHDLVAFAFYEGCGGTPHCGEILASAAPFALGVELTSRYGFTWTMIRRGDEWRFGVSHPRLKGAVDLLDLEGGAWNEEDYDEPPAPGKVTHDSLDAIIKAANARRRDAR